jgi:hypothetical protein
VLKKTVKYVDFDGKEQKETLYFNLTEAEVLRLDLEFEGGLEQHINNLNEKTRPNEILELFEKVLQMSHGEKSEDGRHFIKSDEKRELFSQSAAYSSLFVQLVQDVDEATAFFNALLSRTTVESKKQE